MQELIITGSRGVIVLSDRNTSKIGEEWAPLVLHDFDPNSVSTKQDTMNCIDMNGQHTIGSLVDAKPISFSIAFSGEYMQSAERKGGGEAKMFEYRRKILTLIPVNEVVSLDYYNGVEHYFINARLTEIPVFNAVGSLCSARFIMTADFPFWSREFTSPIYTATTGMPVNVTITTGGDIDSPIIGTFTCIQPIIGNTSGVFFTLRKNGTNVLMSFVKNLTVGQKLVFNSGMNNEVWVKLIETDGTEKFANHYVRYRDSAVLTNNVGVTQWQLDLFGTSGSLSVQMQYQNLYIGV